MKEGNTHVSERDRERETLTFFPNGSNSQSWAGAKTGTRSFFLVYHVGVGLGSQLFGTLPFSSCIRKELDRKYSSADLH